MHPWTLIHLLTAMFQASPLPADPLLIEDVTIIDVETAKALPGQNLMLQNGRITRITPHDIKAPKGTRIISGHGRFLIPGLWDVHTHLWQGQEAALMVLVANGVTSVRDMGGDLEQILGWRKAIAAGTLVGPRIKTCGPMMEGSRYMENLRERASKKPEFAENFQLMLHKVKSELSTAENARQVVASLKARGVDFIKHRTITEQAIFFAMADEAAKHGLLLAGHAPHGEVALFEAIEKGQRSIEHGLYPTEPEKLQESERQKLLALMKNAPCFMVPTQISWEKHMIPIEEVLHNIEDREGKIDPRNRYLSPLQVKEWRRKNKGPFPGMAAYLEMREKNMALLREAGIAFMAGTDLGFNLVYPGSGLHEEMALMVDKLKLTPGEALRAATIHPAMFFDMEDALGKVQAGYIADLVLLEKNPLA